MEILYAKPKETGPTKLHSDGARVQGGEVTPRQLDINPNAHAQRTPSVEGGAEITKYEVGVTVGLETPAHADKHTPNPKKSGTPERGRRDLTPEAITEANLTACPLKTAGRCSLNQTDYQYRQETWTPGNRSSRSRGLSLSRGRNNDRCSQGWLWRATGYKTDPFRQSIFVPQVGHLLK